MKADSVIVTTGTFLGGVCHIGKERINGGRFMRKGEEIEPPSNGLSKTFRKYEFPLGRMKTGTPPRIR